MDERPNHIEKSAFVKTPTYVVNKATVIIWALADPEMSPEMIKLQEYGPYDRKKR